MEDTHYVGLLFLNFAVLNILLSLIFFSISVIGKGILTSPHLKSRLFFISLVAPPAISALTVVTSFVPPVFIKIQGEPMFCLNEPYCYIFSFVSPKVPLFNGVVIAATALILLPILYATITLMSYLRVRTIINRLGAGEIIPPFSGTEFNSVPNGMGGFGGIKEGLHGLKVKIIDTPHMISFVWGYLSNILILSTGVLNKLSEDELRCLLAHELSHYRRKDNLLKGLLLLCRNTLFIFPHVHYLFKWWREEIELIGDEAAALSTGRPLDVATALLKMQQKQVSDIGWNIEPYAIGFGMYKDGLLTDRVERLVAINDCKIRPGNKIWPILPSEIGVLTGIIFLFPLFLTAIYQIDPLLLHCYLEKLTN